MPRKNHRIKKKNWKINLPNKVVFVQNIYQIFRPALLEDWPFYVKDTTFQLNQK